MRVVVVVGVSNVWNVSVRGSMTRCFDHAPSDDMLLRRSPCRTRGGSLRGNESSVGALGGGKEWEWAEFAISEVFLLLRQGYATGKYDDYERA